MNITPDMLTNEKRFEGNVAFMYLDTAGNVTVGVGKMLPTVASATALPFVNKSDDTAATTDAITAEFNTVTGLEPGHTPAFYDPLTTLKLQQSSIDALLTSDLQTVAGQIAAQFPDCDSYPTPAQEGLVDMVFNLGIGKLTSGFPTFVTAVAAKDWTKAALQCHRTGISDERNDFVKALFNQAAS